jgi:hypothetical protein|tara:strand:+ start:262 stop:450 length:189 start_codon:yes stop_codon:yes gene_type:complete
MRQRGRSRGKRASADEEIEEDIVASQEIEEYSDDFVASMPTDNRISESIPSYKGPALSQAKA